MKRLILCAVIIAVIIAGAMMSVASIKKKNNILISKLNEAIKLADDGEKEQALDAVRDLNDYWTDYYIKISFLVESSRLDDISTSVAKLRPLLEKDSEEFFSECEVIRFGVTLVYDSELPLWHSMI